MSLYYYIIESFGSYKTFFFFFWFSLWSLDILRSVNFFLYVTNMQTYHRKTKKNSSIGSTIDYLSWVATVVFNMHLLHLFAFSNQRNYFENANTCSKRTFSNFLMKNFFLTFLWSSSPIYKLASDSTFVVLLNNEGNLYFNKVKHPQISAIVIEILRSK